MSKKSTSKKASQTPLMKQYFDVKAKHPDAILLFRVGDFYETFSEDAVKAADILGIVLTNRNNGGAQIELAGFPYHSLDNYLPKLVRAGFRVAICEQLEKPSKEKKIVKRGITEVVTPGITFSDQILDHKKNNYLASVHRVGENIGIALLDVSTGEFLVSEGDLQHCLRLIKTYNPAEIIHSREYKDWVKSWTDDEVFVFHLEPWVFTEQYALDKLKEQFNVENFRGFGIESMKLATVSAGAILEYLMDTQNRGLTHINTIRRIHTEEAVWLDDFTIRNLELVKVQNGRGMSLKHVLDHTISPMGSRMIEKWILMPLISANAINARLDRIESLIAKDLLREGLIDHLKKIGDLERLAGRIPQRRINPRELVQLKVSLQQIQPIATLLSESQNDQLLKVAESLRPCQTLIDKIDQCIKVEPSTLISKGDVIAEGFSNDLDDLRHTVNNSQELLLDIQRIEAENTGIQNLKIGFNNVFGYYLEVTNKYKDKGLIPEHWVRKQTLTGSERYITDELKKLESKILTAKDSIQELEESIYANLLEDVVSYIEDIQHNASLLAQLDCLISFGLVAIKYNYVRPIVDDSLEIDITGGRHPVIEQSMAAGEQYVPNDIKLNVDDQQILMITGPNMSGKSAILRQTALISLMAQMGSYVPATSAKLGIVDKVFTRVGASDSISSGESTFMVEMNETSSIMNNLSERSLILLDEIGRGTSTFDGISIAWALAEFIHEHPQFQPKTLFATHYHELNALANQYSRIRNFNISTKQLGHKVIFLRKLVEGGSEHSFGIHVARMAGMPNFIINRAQEILKELEAKSPGLKEGEITPSSAPTNLQLNIFDLEDKELKELKESILNLELNALTPIDCMMKLAAIQKKLLGQDDS